MPARLKGRWREVEHLLRELGEWAGEVDNLRALAVVGSYAYRRPRMGSDLDIILLTHALATYGPWLGTHSPIAPALFLSSRSWGAIGELRFRRRSGLQLDVGIGAVSWAATGPLDAGTARVVRDGLRTVYDPEQLLARAQDATTRADRLPRVGP